MPGLMERREHPLAPVVALSLADDGTRRYDTIDESQIIRGTEIAPYLPREIWQPPADVDASRHSTRTRADSTCEPACPVCLEAFHEGCLVSRFTCAHVLHWHCANSWLTSRIRAGHPGTCPLWCAPAPAPVQALALRAKPANCLQWACRGKAWVAGEALRGQPRCVLIASRVAAVCMRRRAASRSI
jgi:hypothetical protein